MFSFDTLDESVLAKLPDWLVEKIKAAPQWAQKDAQPVSQDEREFNDPIPDVV